MADGVVRYDVDYDVKKAKSSTSSLASSLKKVAVMAGSAFAVKKVIDFGKESVKRANEQIQAETKLEEIMKKRIGATDEQIQAIKDLASEEQKLGIFGDELIINGQQQLATFASSSETVGVLTGAMNNLVAQQKGVNASSGDFVNIANLMGKALNGQVGALSRVGISFTDAQAEVLKYGTELERAEVLSQVITDNVGDMNQALRNTPEGAMKAISNDFGDIQEMLGKKLLPVISTVTQFLADKFFPAFIDGVDALSPFIDIMVANIPGALEKVIGMFGNAMELFGMFSPLFEEVGNSIMSLIENYVLPFAGHFEGIASLFEWVFKDALGYAIDQAVIFFQRLYESSEESFGALVETALGAFASLGDLFYSFVQFAKRIWDEWGNDIMDVVSLVFSVLIDIMSVGFQLITDLASVFSALFSGDWEAMWEAIGNLFSNAMEGLENAWKRLMVALEEALKIADGILKGLFDAMLGALKALFDKFKETVSGAWDKMWNGFKDTVSKVFDGIKDTVKSGVNFVIEQINKLIRKVNSFKLPKFLGGGGLDIDEIPELANGGIVDKATLSLIGEGSSPEAIVPLTSAGISSFVGGIGGMQRFSQPKIEVVNTFDENGITSMVIKNWDDEYPFYQ
jgi:hypothetical protein